MKPLHFQRGFTLVELIIVMVIMGIIGGMVAIFIKSPMDAYFASARRSAMTDVADTTLRRMSRELRTALPNSVRPYGNQCIEFIATKTGGRYRENDIVSGDGTGMAFAASLAPAVSFNMFGDNSSLPLSQQIARGDVIVVYNTGQTGADAYQQDNTATVAGVTLPSPTASSPETTITITQKRFPLESPTKRFQVIPGAGQSIVAYVCHDGNLHRSVRALDPLGALPAASCPYDGPILVSQVIACNFNYDVGRNTNAFVSLQFRLNSNGETVTLQNEVNMGITP